MRIAFSSQATTLRKSAPQAATSYRSIPQPQTLRFGTSEQHPLQDYPHLRQAWELIRNGVETGSIPVYPKGDFRERSAEYGLDMKNNRTTLLEKDQAWNGITFTITNHPGMFKLIFLSVKPMPRPGEYTDLQLDLETGRTEGYGIQGSAHLPEGQRQMSKRELQRYYKNGAGGEDRVLKTLDKLLAPKDALNCFA